MRRFFLFILIVALTASACEHPVKNVNLSKNPKDGYALKIKIPTEWIEKVRKFDYSTNTQPLIKEFEGFIKPDTINNPHAIHVAKNYGRLLNAMFVDLDSDQNEELICLLGWDVCSPSLCIFKKEGGDWYLIHLEIIYTFYSEPTIYVANNFSRNKTFYLRHVDEHGSGIYIDSYSFYKLIDNKVYKCLDIINDAHIYGWGLYMNQNVTASLDFSGDVSDGLGVEFTYNFFPGAINDGDCPWCVNENVPLIKGKSTAGYTWDAKSKTYKFDIPEHPEIDDLTPQKVACFAAFGNDTLFVRAFKRNIDTALLIGSPKQKMILKRYLAMVKKDKQATTHEIKKTMQTGGTSFYSSEPKK